MDQISHRFWDRTDVGWFPGRRECTKSAANVKKFAVNRDEARSVGIEHYRFDAIWV